MVTDMVISAVIFILLFGITFGANDKSVRYANLNQGFRSYDLVMGDPYNALSDPGYKGHIFDPEDESLNLAGHPMRSCSTILKSDYYSESTNFLQDTIATKGSSSSMTIGPETTVNAQVGAGGVSVGVSRKIPPLLTASSSNSNTMQKTLNTLDSREFSLTKTVAYCSLHEFDILETQHPRFKKEFMKAVKDLSKCINDDKCVKKFFRNYGTHYIERGISGSKITAIKYYSIEEAASLKIEGVQECSEKDKTWSLLGVIGEVKVSTQCKKTETTNHNWKIHGLERYVTLTVGSAPKNSLEAWADQITNSEIITKELRPLSDLFTDEFMKDVINVPYKTMKPVLAQHIGNYCHIFKDEQRCSFVVGFEISLENCRITSGFLSSLSSGKYTGPVDREFLASTTTNQVGVLRIGTSDKIVLSGQWKNGCPVVGVVVGFEISLKDCPISDGFPSSLSSGKYTGPVDREIRASTTTNQVGVLRHGTPDKIVFRGQWRNGCPVGPASIHISKSSCTWLNTDYWNDRLQCAGDEVAVGMCSGGGNKDCSNYTVHKLKCCKQSHYYNSNCKTYGSSYGTPINCRNRGAMLTGSCASGWGANCHGNVNEVVCCHGVVQGQKIQENESTCHEIKSTGFGDDIECGKDEVMVQKCGSGGKRDCKSSSHTIVCCKLQYK